MQALNYGTYYNLSYLAEVAEGDYNFVQELTQTFVKQTPPMIDELKASVLNNNFDRTNYLAHKLKSSCEILGMQFAAGICLKIELAAMNKRNLNALIDDLEVLVHQLFVSTYELTRTAHAA